MLVIIKYNAGNLQSVSFALDRLGVPFTISDDPETIMSADKVIFPGVGEASTTIRYLRQRKLDDVIRQLRQPVLGICLGMQLLCRRSEENNTECLGIFDETVQRFEPKKGFKVPHMGWNQLKIAGDSWIGRELDEASVYFVHSFYVPVNRFTLATTDYVKPFSAAMRKDNFYAVQFHPEKSAEPGKRILQKFLEI